MRFRGAMIPSMRSKRPTARCIGKSAPSRRAGPDWRRAVRSGDDVGQELALDFRDLVLEQQLALLEPLELQLIERPMFGNARNHVVEVAVLDLQGRKLGLQGFDVEIHRRGASFAHDESGATRGNADGSV